MGQYERAITHGNKAVSYFRKTNNIPWLAYNLNSLAVTYIRKNDFSTALGLLLEATQLAERMGDLDTKAALLINIADIYLNQGIYTKMKLYYQQSLVLNKQIGSQEGIAISLRGLF